MSHKLRSCELSSLLNSTKLPSEDYPKTNMAEATITTRTPSLEMNLQNNLDLVPGTEIMDSDGRAKKALIPRPSLDPQDPLNWSTAWKRRFQS